VSQVSASRRPHWCGKWVALLLMAATSVDAREPRQGGDPGQWDVEAIGAAGLTPPAAEQPIVVAVIDTGLDYFHPDLDPASVWRNPSEIANGEDDDDNGYVDDLIGWNFIDGNNNPWDYAGHGTHVAGVIAASAGNGVGIAGLNPQVQIMPLKILNFVGRGRSVAMAEAVYYAVNHGAHIINLSLGSENLSEVERMAISWAYDQGVGTVVAAGNSGVSTDTFGPAGTETALTVAALDRDLKRAAFSNWGKAIDLAAPGVDILSLRARHTDFALVAGQVDYSAGQGYVGDDNAYYLATGTSFAAPLVTGVATLLLARDPGLSAEKLFTLLRETATDIEQPGLDQLTGYGLVNAEAALSAGDIGWITARIAGVGVAEGRRGKQVLRVTGTADAEDFRHYWIELGEGVDPKRWKRQGGKERKPVESATLIDLDIADLRGSNVWVIKLVVEAHDGRQREIRFELNLG